MKIPNAPRVETISSISPTLFESARLCKAKAAYQVFSERGSTPFHPAQLLGIGYHFVMQETTLGKISNTNPEEALNSARRIFDSELEKLFTASHPLLRVKFGNASDLPFYALYRERASQKAAAMTLGVVRKSEGPTSASSRSMQVETDIYSRDRRIRGRPDLVSCEQGIVVDYKSGSATERDVDGVREAEKRQLLLYSYLLRENDILVDKGIIERGDGTMGEIALPVESGDCQAKEAREALADFNNVVREGLEVMASPSPEVCGSCSAKPQCKPFWKAATADWADAVGIHAEGMVAEISTLWLSGVDIATIRLEVDAGTTRRGEGSLEQVPVSWITADGSATPAVGDRIRIVDAKLASADPLVLRSDRTMTAVWGPVVDDA